MLPACEGFLFCFSTITHKSVRERTTSKLNSGAKFRLARSQFGSGQCMFGVSLSISMHLCLYICVVWMHHVCPCMRTLFVVCSMVPFVRANVKMGCRCPWYRLFGPKWKGCRRRQTCRLETLHHVVSGIVPFLETVGWFLCSEDLAHKGNHAFVESGACYFQSHK